MKVDRKVWSTMVVAAVLCVLIIEVFQRPYTKVEIEWGDSKNVKANLLEGNGEYPFVPTIQSFLISSHQSQYQTFLRRNSDALSSKISVTWFPASNGRDQIILDEFAQLTGFPPVNSSQR